MSPWYDDEYEHRKRLPADGIRAQTSRGKFGKSWWASRWIAALERLVDAARLGRGRSYARSGQVLNLDIKPGRVDSRVQGSRPSPYKVRIEITPLNDRAWDAVADVMTAQALFAAKLLVGEMPQNIEEAFTAAGVSLFPDRSGDLATKCSCPDSANPCKHIAAVYYLLGEQFDADPFLIFQLRGRDKEQIMAALRTRRATGDAATSKQGVAVSALPAPEQVVPLEQCLERFWERDETTDTQPARFAIAAPPIDAAPIKRLGPPPFWSGQPSFTTLMSQAYAQIAKAALDVAFGE
jgi:uncharacterized Zn finger protein